eukprot:SAG31_NODE_2584_length_5434_cov_3.784067_3_plen_48_part_00
MMTKAVTFIPCRQFFGIVFCVIISKSINRSMESCSMVMEGILLFWTT